jgi:hypothetical protein
MKKKKSKLAHVPSQTEGRCMDELGCNGTPVSPSPRAESVQVDSAEEAGCDKYISRIFTGHVGNRM